MQPPQQSVQQNGTRNYKIKHFRDINFSKSKEVHRCNNNNSQLTGLQQMKKRMTLNELKTFENL